MSKLFFYLLRWYYKDLLMNKYRLITFINLKERKLASDFVINK